MPKEIVRQTSTHSTQRLPHMQSEYSIFRNMSQALTQVIAEQNDTTLQQMIVRLQGDPIAG